MSETSPVNYVKNEYGVSSVDYWSKPKPETIARYVRDHNISTHLPDGRPIHTACINCQIVQIDKYKESYDYTIKVAGVILRVSDDNSSETVAHLRQSQLVTLISRKGDWCNIRTTTTYARCMEHPDEHPVVFSDKRDLLEQGKCIKCESRFRVISEQSEGWVEWKHMGFFKIPCKFIPARYEIPKQLQATLSPEDAEKAKNILDPVGWVNHYLGMEPRPHQQLNLMCTARNIVLREGRRSGKTWGECFWMLYYVLTTEIFDGKDAEGNIVYRGPKVVVATPYLSQIELIFGILDKMIERNKEIKKTVVRHVRTPFHVIKFSNGASIEGFTTGAQSKQEAGTVRGQDADLLLLDEVDIMDSDDITRSIRPIQITSVDVRLMVSSTPTGKREWFYNICKNDPRFKEFYFPSTVISHWEEVKAEAEAEGTHEYFLQEYMAVFTVQITGVYQPTYVAQAETPYAYGQREPYLDHRSGKEIFLSKRNEDWIYTMGVDWNTNAGTEILVGGLDKKTMDFWVTQVINVPKQDWQQKRAMDAIVELNALWLPKYIYVDRGYGATQIEMLQRHAMEVSMMNPSDPAARMVENLHAYDFGSKVEYRDPMTNRVKKTHAKAFLVENSVRRFEESRIHYSNKDQFLTKQLLNYIIAGYTPTGIPKYSMNSEKIGDHRLDALNLALIPFKLHLTDFAVMGEPCTSVGFMKGFGAGVTVSTVQDDGQIYEEVAVDFPRDENGNLLAGGEILNFRHDPGYVEKKRAEGYNEVDFSRNRKLDVGRNDNEIPDLRIGWQSDTEYKYKKNPTSKVVRRSHTKPPRRTF